MLKFLELYRDNLSNTFKDDEYIYRILLKTGKYMNAKDIIYLNYKI